MAERITASEIIRRINGPWTDEELAEREAQNEKFDREVFEPYLRPLLRRLQQLMDEQIVKILLESGNETAPKNE